MDTRTIAAAMSAAVTLMGCEAHPRPAGTPMDHDGSSHATARAGALFDTYCARCHGRDGRWRSGAPPLMGEHALPLEPPPTARLRTAPFRTAADVMAFVRENMPADQPGRLKDEDYASIVAFVLVANGVDLAGAEITPSSAPLIMLR